MHRDGPRNEGQALVETAIVMPLYVFLILGLLQLGLAHQARLMTKYAAYQAARAGALNDNDPTAMRKAALGVLLPLASKKSGEFEYVKKINSGTSYVEKWAEFYTMRQDWLVPGMLRIADVIICGPTTDEFGKTKGEIDFDDPKYDAAAWKTNQETKLRVQVLFNYRMPIPFANWMIAWMNLGLKAPYAVLRMKKPALSLPKLTPAYLTYVALAKRGIYVIPIRASYNMRMQSNIYLKNIPKTNKCVVPWSFKK